MSAWPSTVLWLNAVVFAGFGVAFFARPAEMAAIVDVAVDSPTARAEIRAMYGGLELGIAVFLVWCALDPSRARMGLLASALALLGLGTGRLIAVLLGGGSSIHWRLIAVEVVAAALSFHALWLARPR